MPPPSPRGKLNLLHSLAEANSSDDLINRDLRDDRLNITDIMVSPATCFEYF